ncbi:MAG: hypothetical protein IKO34_03420 [Bacteroidales bacterium]|nr:hypothetical protein [Bacteroidales bacterium]
MGRERLRPTRIRDKMMISRNRIIRLKDVASFEGNVAINNLESLVDEMFKDAESVSIENFERRYKINEKQILIDDICRLQKEKE